MYPILFQLGPVTFKTLGVFIAFAVLASSLVLIQFALKQKLNLDFLSDNLLSSVLGAVIFSRLFYVAGNWYKYSSSLLDIIKIQDGGFSFWGALIGLGLVFFFWSKRQKISVWPWFDAVIFSGMLGLSIVYLGFLFSGDVYGVPTDLPWGITFENPEVRFTDPVHPTQIYGMLGIFLIFIILLILSKKRRKEGFLALSGLLFYCIFDFGLDFFLGDRQELILNLSSAQIFDLVFGLGTMLLLFMRTKIKYRSL